jgi:hypothetical protein
MLHGTSSSCNYIKAISISYHNTFNFQLGNHMLERLKENIWMQIFIIYTRYLIGGAFVFASIVKIKGGRFTAQSGASNPIDSSWHLFETLYQSGLYWRFLGVAQLVSGFLLISQRYAKLGALINFPIIANVFVITLSYYFAYTPVITGLMLLANIVLLVWDWNTLKVLVNLKPDLANTKRLEQDIVWQVLGLVLFSLIIVGSIFASRVAFITCFGVGFLIGIVGLVLGLKRNRLYQLL